MNTFPLLRPVLLLGACFAGLFLPAQSPVCVDSSLINPNAICPAVYDPVCGCNGLTYGNSCEAIANGVLAWTPGPCGADTVDCPNGCFFNVYYEFDGVAFRAWLLPDPTDPPLPDSISWSLDDGDVTAESPEFAHLFAGPGRHTLCATYNNAAGEACTACKAFRVQAACVDSSLIDTLGGCPDNYDPVCGCDGVTYSNACEAETFHGISAWRPGVCGSLCNDLSVDFSGFNSGGSLTYWTFNSQVVFPGGQSTIWFWDFGNGQTSTEPHPSLNFMQPGDYEVCLTVTAAYEDDIICISTVCQTVHVSEAFCVDATLIDTTLACPAVYDPVCGCDGVTYGNACEALSHHGVTSWTPGVCPTDCFDPSWMLDNLGCPENYDPVCGCDGVTYKNSCIALKYGGATAWNKGVCCPSASDCQAFFLLETLPDRTVRLSDLSINAESWCLDLGDGTVHQGYFDSLLHTYTAPGTYPICLTISNFPGNCSQQYCAVAHFGATGLSGLSLQPAIRISPNPASGQTTVLVSGAQPERVTVLDVLGKIMLDYAVASPEFDVEISGLPDGIYIVVVETEQGRAVRKLVVRR